MFADDYPRLSMNQANEITLSSISEREKVGHRMVHSHKYRDKEAHNFITGRATSGRLQSQSSRVTQP
jgi:hypothetical protein